MANYDARIILAGQPVDAIGALRGGNAAAAETNALRVQNDLTNVYRQHGPGIMAGDQNALNALAGIDPMAALGVAEARQRMDMLSREEQRAVAAAAANKTAEERQAAAAELENAVRMGLMIESPEQWDAIMSREAPDLVGQFDNRRALAAKFMTMAQVLKEMEPEAPMTEAAKLRADMEAGRLTPEQYQTEMARRAPRGTSVSVSPDGTVQFIEGAGVGSPTGEPRVGDVYDPGSVQSALDVIDQIANTPEDVMGRITGTVMGGGGNNIDDLNAAQRFYYGEEGTAVVEMLGQLQSKTWLAARAMLKGGGHITDYESRKAESAVARLSRAKGPEQLRSALSELQEVLQTGLARYKAGQQVPADAGPDAAAPAASPAATTDFSGMTLEQLGAVDIDSLDQNGVRAWIERYNSLGGGQ